jgi:2-amino-4-hydroxy-6-hydroxymethyldihydropteridine diphosphokinase
VIGAGAGTRGPEQGRASILRRALVLEWLSIAWMLAEGGVALWAGLAAHSLSLEAFGLDSLIEIVTAGVVLWRLQVEVRSSSSPGDGDRVASAERASARIVAASLLALAVYILVGAVDTLRARAVAHPGFWGFVVAITSVGGMPLLYAAKQRAARALESEALHEDAVGNLTCGLMALILLAGLAAQRAGLWWADPGAALLLGAVVLREGWEAWGHAAGAGPPSVQVFLGLGSNQGDRAQILARARALLDTPEVRILATSRVYESPPWGVGDQPWFLNQVIATRTTLSPGALLARCHDVEALLGRTRTVRWGPRSIDVDILLYGTLETTSADLVIPHAQLRHRAFMLVPLAELAPGLRVPGAETVEALLALLPDRGHMREYVPGTERAGGPER